GTWHHKGSWCDKILQIVLDDCEKYERIVRAKEKAIEDELSRLKDKFGKLFSGDKDAAKV
ncbi:hypothetical protein M5X02_30700, partial [Paenibacillus alvei]|nr:hypothetical protein [Paenibacillus alvei]